jgi:hypothetical protein
MGPGSCCTGSDERPHQLAFMRSGLFCLMIRLTHCMILIHCVCSACSVALNLLASLDSLDRRLLGTATAKPWHPTAAGSTASLSQNALFGA